MMARVPAWRLGRSRPAPDRAVEKIPRLRLAALAAWLVLALGCGCAKLSVSHLDSKPFAAGTTETVSTKYWRFAFSSFLKGDAYGLRGRATPVPAALPPWADSLEELTITAYLRDAAGNVLASAAKSYRGMPLGPDTAVPFAFLLFPKGALPPGGMAVSFGYKAVYGSSTARQTLPGHGQPPAGTAVFAGEGALLTY